MLLTIGNKMLKSRKNVLYYRILCVFCNDPNILNKLNRMIFIKFTVDKLNIFFLRSPFSENNYFVKLITCLAKIKFTKKDYFQAII